eukprot:TRINITY_DN21272_c0_g3_i1.p1 TRINITY_DN21272_c0_g3~~TRINITY_DN21272_c0_g3_i1.p1  ORF type:complete len:1209 (-),score=309.41 TRINITY_DN21272_c0_g3_i1:76-3702(-)
MRALTPLPTTDSLLLSNVFQAAAVCDARTGAGSDSSAYWGDVASEALLGMGVCCVRNLSGGKCRSCWCALCQAPVDPVKKAGVPAMGMFMRSATPGSLAGRTTRTPTPRPDSSASFASVPSSARPGRLSPAWDSSGIDASASTRSRSPGTPLPWHSLEDALLTAGGGGRSPSPPQLLQTPPLRQPLLAFAYLAKKDGNRRSRLTTVTPVELSQKQTLDLQTLVQMGEPSRYGPMPQDLPSRGPSPYAEELPSLRKPLGGRQTPRATPQDANKELLDSRDRDDDRSLSPTKTRVHGYVPKPPVDTGRRKVNLQSSRLRQRIKHVRKEEEERLHASIGAELFEGKGSLEDEMHADSCCMASRLNGQCVLRESPSMSQAQKDKSDTARALKSEYEQQKKQERLQALKSRVNDIRRRHRAASVLRALGVEVPSGAAEASMQSMDFKPIAAGHFRCSLLEHKNELAQRVQRMSMDNQSSRRASLDRATLQHARNVSWAAKQSARPDGGGDEVKRQKSLDPSRRLQEQNKILVDERERDAKQALAAFNRYDVDGSGHLDLSEIRAVFEDVGMLPVNREEKAAVRRTILNMRLDKEDGLSDEESEGEDLGLQLDLPFKPRLNKSVTQVSEEDALVRSFTCTREALPALLERVRARLKECRQREVLNLFHSCDTEQSGKVDFLRVLDALEAVNLMPETVEEQKTFSEWLSNVVEPKRRGRQARLTSRRTVNRLQEREATDAVAAQDAAIREKAAKPSAYVSPREGLLQRCSIEVYRRFYSYAEFELMVNYLREWCDLRNAMHQIEFAEELGLEATSELFIEFRSELGQLRSIFEYFDSDRSGFLDKFECWVALNMLGLMPTGTLEEKVGIMDLISQAAKEFDSPVQSSHVSEGVLSREVSEPQSQSSSRSSSTTQAEAFDPLHPGSSKQLSDYSAKVTGPCRQGKRTSETLVQAIVKSAQTGRTQTISSMQRQDSPGAHAHEDGHGSGGLLHNLLITATEDDGSVVISFPCFLHVLSSVRKHLQQKCRDELKSIFLRLTFKGASTSNGQVLTVPEVFTALTQLGMAPRNAFEQVQIKNILDKADEWGFEPQVLDFETFCSFIRRVREWVAASERSRERDLAHSRYNFSEKVVNEYRLAYDALDESGAGLDIAGVRRIFRMFGKSIDSEQLRSLFHDLDDDDSGLLSFVEFLQLVHMCFQDEEAAEEEEPASPRLRM